MPRAVFALLLSRGAQWTFPESPMATELNLLIKAALYCHQEPVVELLLHGADPRLSLPDGTSASGLLRGVNALHGALSNTFHGGSPEIVAALLLKFGADVDARMIDERPVPTWHEPTALASATQHGSIEVIRILLDAGADPDARDRQGRNAEDRLLQIIDGRLPGPPQPDIIAQNKLALLRDVREAGSWRRYVNQPRSDLMVLLRLCSSGRALPPADFYTQLRALPPPLTFLVLSFWRTPRDAPGGLLDGILD